MGHGRSKDSTTADIFGAAASVLDSLVSVQQGKLNQEIEMHKVKVTQREAKLDRLHTKEMDKLDFLQGLYATAREEYNVQKKDYGVLETLPIESASGKTLQSMAKDGYNVDELESAIALLDSMSLAKEVQINSFETGKLLYQAVDDSGDADGVVSSAEMDAFLTARKAKVEGAGKKFMIDPDAFRYGVESSLSSIRERKDLAQIEAGTDLTEAKTETEGATTGEITARARMLNAQAAKEEHLNLGLPSVTQMQIMTDQTIDLKDVQIMGEYKDIEKIRKDMELVSAQVALTNVQTEKIASEVAEADYLQNKDTYEFTRTRLDEALLFNNEKQGEISTAMSEVLGYYDNSEKTWKPFLSMIAQGRMDAVAGDTGSLNEMMARMARDPKFRSVDGYKTGNLGPFIGIGENGDLKKFFNAMYLSGIGDPAVTQDTYKTMPPLEVTRTIAQIHTEYSPMKAFESSINHAFQSKFADDRYDKITEPERWTEHYNKAKGQKQSDKFNMFLKETNILTGNDKDTYYRYLQWKNTGFFDVQNETMLNSAIAVYNQRLANDGLREKLIKRAEAWGMEEALDDYGDPVSQFTPISPIFQPFKVGK